MKSLILGVHEVAGRDVGIELDLGNGETTLSRQIRLLRDHGVDEFLIVTDLAERAAAQIDDRLLADPALTYSFDDPTGAQVSDLLDRAESVGTRIVVSAIDMIFGSRSVARLAASEESLAFVTEPERDHLGVPVNSWEADPHGGPLTSGLRAVRRDGTLDAILRAEPTNGTAVVWPLLALRPQLLREWLSYSPAYDLRNLVSTSAPVRPLKAVAGTVVRWIDDPAWMRQALRRIDVLGQEIVKGTDAVRTLADEMSSRGLLTVLLVSDDIDVDAVLDGPFAEAGIEVVHMPPQSGRDDLLEVDEGVRLVREHACRAVIGVGHSRIALAKRITLHESSDGDRGASRVPLVVVPSGAGYGLESHGIAEPLSDHDVSAAYEPTVPDLAVVDTSLVARASGVHRLQVIARTIGQSVLASIHDPSSDAVRALGARSIRDVIGGFHLFLGNDDVIADGKIVDAAHRSGEAIALAQLPREAVAEVLAIEAESTSAPSLWIDRASALISETDRRVRSEPDPAVGARLRLVLDGLCSALGAPTPGQGANRLLNLRSLLDDLASPEAIPTRSDLIALSLFDATARQAGIRYYLYGDALKDAVTYGVLEPWRGEICIAMPRSQYDTLLRWADQLHPHIALERSHSAPHRSSPYPRIVLRDAGASPRPAQGPGVEIRVLEEAVDPWGTLSLRDQIRLRVLHAIVPSVETASPRRQGRLARLLSPFSRRIESANLDRVKRKLGTAATKGRILYFDPGSSALLERELFPASWFGKATSVDLHGRKYPAPVNSAALLNATAGTPGNRSTRIPADKVYRIDRARMPDQDAGQKATAAEIGQEPLVSIIVPVYNVERYLAECLDSLCHQDTANYEIIAVDDGSPDSSIEILRAYEQMYPEIIRVFQKPNGGLSDARNFGLERARGEYVLFVDSDDIVSTALVRLVRSRATETDADIVVFNMGILSDSSKPPRARWMHFKNSYGRSVMENPELLVAAHPYACNKMYRTSLFIDSGIRYPKGQAFEDSATTFNVMLLANKIEYVDRALYIYRTDRPDSITNTFNDRFYDIFKSFESVLNFYAARELAVTFADELSEIVRRTSFARLDALRSCEDRRAVHKFVDAVYDYLESHVPRWAENKYFQSQLAQAKYAQDEWYQSLPFRDKMKAYLDRAYDSKVSKATVASLQSTDELMKELQGEGLAILLDIDRVCHQLGLTYYLAEGTLLGAIRHQGFIPWDDDVDIAMPRADYERLLDVLASGADPELRLFHERTYPKYHLTFAKVLSVRPSKFIASEVDLPSEYLGPAVDIFPLDVATDKRDVPTERRVRRLRDMLLFKVGYMSEKTKRSHYRTYLLSRVSSFDSLRSKIHAEHRKFENDPAAQFTVNFASSYPVDKEKFPTARFGEPMRVPFEGHLLPVPSDWDAVLRTIYGRYMKLPPERQRHPRHRPRVRRSLQSIGQRD